MPPVDLSVHLLTQIRDAVAETNARLDQTNARLDQTNVRLEEMREELSARIVESEIRTSTAITELAGAVNGVVSLLREQRDLAPRVTKCEADIVELKRRLDA